MTALYAIREQRDALDVILAENEGELTPELEAELESLDVSANDKIERCALWISDQLRLADAITEEANRLMLRAQTRKRAAEGLRDYVQREMMRLEKTRVDGVLCTVAIQANPPKVVGEVDEAMLRDWHGFRSTFVNYKETLTLNRRAVLDAHKAGQPIPDGLTVEQSSSLRIK